MHRVSLETPKLTAIRRMWRFCHTATKLGAAATHLKKKMLEGSKNLSPTLSFWATRKNAGISSWCHRVKNKHWELTRGKICFSSVITKSKVKITLQTLHYSSQTWQSTNSKYVNLKDISIFNQTHSAEGCSSWLVYKLMEKDQSLRDGRELHFHIEDWKKKSIGATAVCLINPFSHLFPTILEKTHRKVQSAHLLICFFVASSDYFVSQTLFPQVYSYI